MHYHIILTEKCNLQCKYCYEKSMQEFDNGLEKKFNFDYSEPCTSQVNIQKLKTFISKDPKATIIFYGGEPLLQIGKIKEIMDAFPDKQPASNQQATSKQSTSGTQNVPFRMQTNGQLLHLLEPKYLNRITKILISIDGNEKITDKYRGKGTYKKIMENINLIKNNGYNGELVARMTVAQDNPDIYKNVQDILKITSAKTERNIKSNTSNRIFDSVHWQLDANFYKEDFQEKEIRLFFEKYNQSITKLISWWTQEIQKGNFHFLYPFAAIAKDLLIQGRENKAQHSTSRQSPVTNHHKVGLRCGAGHSGYTISTSGKIVACPIMNNIKNFECGNLDSDPSELKKIKTISPCTECEEQNLCGGRCLYSNHAKLWEKKGENIICDSIRHLINKSKSQIPKIKRAIKEKKISEQDFNYEKYFGPEIIP